MKDVVVQGEGRRRKVWMKCWKMVYLFSYGKVVTGDRRCGVRLRGLPKENGCIGAAPEKGGFVFLREGRGR